MNSDRRTILTLIAAGRITPAQAERLLAVVNESRETAWILALCLAGACVAQVHLLKVLPSLVHFFITQVPALAETTLHALGPITKFLGGSL